MCPLYAPVDDCVAGVEAVEDIVSVREWYNDPMPFKNQPSTDGKLIGETRIWFHR